MSRINLKINRRGINSERSINPVKGNVLHCKACDKEIDHSELEDLCTYCLKYSYYMTDIEYDFDPSFYEDSFDSSFESQIDELFDSLEPVDQ